MPEDYFSVSVDGLEEMLSMLDKLAEKAGGEAFLQAWIDIGFVAEEYIQIALDKFVYDTKESPNYKRTKFLKNKTGASGKTSRKGDEYTTQVISAAYYAPYVHFGTENKDGSTRMAARPYMIEGTQRAIPDMVDLLAEFIADV